MNLLSGVIILLKIVKVLSILKKCVNSEIIDNTSYGNNKKLI